MNTTAKKEKRVSVIESESATEIKLAAEAINALAKGVAEMRRFAKDKLIVLMLNDVTGISKRDCKTIIDCIPELARIYTVSR